MHTHPACTPDVWSDLNALASRTTPVTVTATAEPLPDGTFVGSLTGLHALPQPVTGHLIPTTDGRLLMRRPQGGYLFPLDLAHIAASHLGLSPDRRSQYTLDLDEGLGGSRARLTLTLS